MDHSYSRRDVSTTLQALCRQEETSYRITGNYLATEGTDARVARRRAKCRSAMVTWFITVVDYLEFERETVAIALNYLDRFLETPQGLDCLTTPRRFKMAGITCLYTAIKTHEPEAIEPDLVVELSGNLCEIEDIEAMERTILAALDWRVNPPTALAFCRQLLNLVPRGVVNPQDCGSLLDLAQVQTELAVSDQRLITTPPSLLAMASIFNALESSKNSTAETLDDLSSLFFVAMAGSATLDMDSVFDVQDILDDIIRQHNQPEATSEGEDQAKDDTNDDDAVVTHRVEEHESEEQEDENDLPTPEAPEEEEEDPAASPTTPAKEMAISVVPTGSKLPAVVSPKVSSTPPYTIDIAEAA